MTGRAIAICLLVCLSGSAIGQAAPSGCPAPESRQFDFWIGEWSVVDLKTKEPAGTSHIERLYGGCVLRENWSSDGFRGGSLNSYWRGDKKWHQTWMDSAGAFRHFVGGLDPTGKMVLTSEQPNPDVTCGKRLIRLSFIANRDGTVRQYSDFSDDDGQSWKTRYDFLYTRLTP